MTTDRRTYRSKSNNNNNNNNRINVTIRKSESCLKIYIMSVKFQLMMSLSSFQTNFFVRTLQRGRREETKRREFLPRVRRVCPNIYVKRKDLKIFYIPSHDVVAFVRASLRVLRVRI